MKTTPIIGLEIHVELKTNSKMFCGCKNNPFESKPNSNICPVCTAQPGALPVPNKEAIRKTILTGLALHSEIARFSKFDRKNYFYPDLPKGYQISQYDQPLCVGGYLDIKTDDGKINKVRLKRIHLEEDTGKLIHKANGGDTLVDLNRAGVPLMEIVTLPDLHSAEEASVFLKELQKILRTLGVSDADMEKGQMRGEANVSVQEEDSFREIDGGVEPVEGKELQPLAEIKNLNSFKAVKLAVEYEIKRRTEALEKGEKLHKETLGWDDLKGETVHQRFKEEANDYRYFPEPDITPLRFKDEEIEAIKAELPELPSDKERRLIEQLGIKQADARLLASNKLMAEFFENTLSEFESWAKATGEKEEEIKKYSRDFAQLTSNWVLGELVKIMREEESEDISTLKITPENMAEFINMIKKGEISSSAGQQVLLEMFKTGGDPSNIVGEKDLKQVSNKAELDDIVARVLTDNEDVSNEYKSGKENAIQFLIGQVMKETKGKANPQVVSDIIKAQLKK